MIKVAILAALDCIEPDDWGFVSKQSIQKRTHTMKLLLEVLNQLEETNMDRACWTRGCACYDDRVDKDYVIVEGIAK